VHIVSLGWHALQSVPAALQPDGHVLVVLRHAPLESHIAAVVLTPPVHDCAAPHSVPTGLLPLATHTDVPVAHEVTPSLHGSECVHATPAVQGTQLPIRQTRFMPQLLPSGTDVPVSWQVAMPVVQVSVPVWHGLFGVQVPPAVQGAHAPLLHTRLSPHAVPFGRFPVSAHTDAPVTHDVAPVRHGFVGWQLAPAVHAAHAPPLQTRLIPHTVPLARLLPVSMHVIAGEQAVSPA
jgi:hypothetical protein